MSWLPHLSNPASSKDVRTRTLFLVSSAVLILLVALLAWKLFGQKKVTNSSAAPGGARVVLPPASIQSNPVGDEVKRDAVYEAIQLKENEKRARTALDTGSSAVPTIVGSQVQSNRSRLFGSGDENSLKREIENQMRLKAEENQLRLAQQNKSQDLEFQDKMRQAQQGLMDEEMKRLRAKWRPAAQKTEGSQVLMDAATAADNALGGAGAAATPAGVPLYKAGDVVYGVLETGINSDEASPIVATMVSGELSGAKLIGNIRLVGEKVLLTFNVLNGSHFPRSIPIEAVAIDAQTARTALATRVDRHLLVRYGGLLASSFLEGVGEAVSRGVQPNYAFDPKTGTVSITSVTSGTREQILLGLGKVGTRLADSLNNFNRPPTITVAPGTSIGILFTQDFYLEGSGTGKKVAPRPEATAFANTAQTPNPIISGVRNRAVNAPV